MLQRRTEAAIAEVDGEPMEIAMTNDAFYENMLEVRTYQNIETKYRNDPASLKKYLTGFKYIVADECHYFTDFSSYGINTYLSLEVLQKAEADHVVIYMSATGEETYKLLEETSKTPEDRIYKLPQDYQHIKQKYFYSRENLVMMLKCLPEDEKAVIFVSSGGDLLKMKEIFGDTAAYYCSENNPKYGKMFNKLTECVKDRELQKRYLFTTKAFGIGTEIKDRTVKHLYIDQWKPTDIIQSTGRKRPLDVDDTCTVYFRDYDADWYYGDLKKFKAIVIEELRPAVAYLAGAEAFEVFRNSGKPDSINNKIRKCKIMEFDDAKGEYRVNPLGVRQLKRELELLNEMLETSYKQVFAKYAPVLAEETVPYRFDSVVDWINAHLNQPMLKEDIFMNNVFASKENHRIRRNVEYLIPAFLFVAMSIIKGNRVDIMQLVVMAVFLYYMFLHRKVGWNKHISGKMLKKAIMVFAIGMVLFYYMKELVGRVSSLNFLEYITQYIGGSIQLLDQYVRESSHVIDVPFGETLTGLITGLRKLGLTTASLRKQLEFRYTPTGIYLGNVYTALRRYYNDAGWIGVVVFPAILSLIMNAFYRKVRLYKDNTIKHVYNTIVYASLLYVVPFQAMEDSFYINKVTIGYVMELTILYVCVLFVFKKIRLR